MSPLDEIGERKVSCGTAPRYFLRDDRLRPPPLRLRGTFAPALRASLKPMAIACLRLVTFLPDRPERNVPCLRSRIARSTFFCAFLPYFAMRRFSFSSVGVARTPRAR